jgi:hypothetical protein
MIFLNISYFKTRETSWSHRNDDYDIEYQKKEMKEKWKRRRWESPKGIGITGLCYFIKQKSRSWKRWCLKNFGFYSLKRVEMTKLQNKKNSDYDYHYEDYEKIQEKFELNIHSFALSFYFYSVS